MLYNGETENAWLADLMVGWGGDYRKVGSSSQSERLTKHNSATSAGSEDGISLRKLFIPPILPQSRPRFLSSPESS